MNFNEKNLEEMNTANDTIPQKDDISIEKEGSAEEKTTKKSLLSLTSAVLIPPKKPRETAHPRKRSPTREKHYIIKRYPLLNRVT